MERLDKILAGTGRWSRREVKELVRQGRVRVDGQTLPEDLSAHAEYAALQKGLGLPFDRCGGKTVTRYTYTVLNYPELSQGVQANLLVCGDQVIGGDVTALGENGFRPVLSRRCPADSRGSQTAASGPPGPPGRRLPAAAAS